MARKQVGMIDGDLLARVDACAAERGQTRRVFIERACGVALGEAVVARALDEGRIAADDAPAFRDLLRAEPGDAQPLRSAAPVVRETAAMARQPGRDVA